MRTLLKLVLALAVIAAVVWGLSRTVLAPQPALVRTVTIERGPVEVLVANTKAGTVRARRRAKLSPGTSGLVTDVPVERGERVEAGAVLLRLDDATQRAALRLAERDQEVSRASHAKACLAAEQAQRELVRRRALAGDSIVSEDELDRYENARDVARAECDVAAARVERGRAAVDAAQEELSKTVLRAPFDAIVAEVEVEIGEWVTPSVSLLAAPELIDAIDPGSIYISAPMDETEAARLTVGLPARVTLDSHRGRSFAGKVVRVAPYVLDLEAQNRTVEVEVELEDEAFAARLLPGTSADVELILDVARDVLRAPTLALYEGDVAFVVRDGFVVERAVERGRANWDWVEVLAGLEEGERVVTHFDADALAHGDEVRLEAPEGAGDAGDAP